jgi:hypothetical protein
MFNVTIIKYGYSVSVVQERLRNKADTELWQDGRLFLTDYETI